MLDLKKTQCCSYLSLNHRGPLGSHVLYQVEDTEIWRDHLEISTETAKVVPCALIWICSICTESAMAEVSHLFLQKIPRVIDDTQDSCSSTASTATTAAKSPIWTKGNCPNLNHLFFFNRFICHWFSILKAWRLISVDFLKTNIWIY